MSRWQETGAAGSNVESLSRLWFAEESGLLSQDAFAPPVRPEALPGMESGVGRRVPRKKAVGQRIFASDALWGGRKGKKDAPDPYATSRGHLNPSRILGDTTACSSPELVNSSSK